MKPYSSFVSHLANSIGQVSLESESTRKDESTTFDSKGEDDHGIRLASEPGYRDESNVMIELSVSNDRYHDSVTGCMESLRKDGFKVRMRCQGEEISLESYSDGIMTGNISLNENNEVNNVMNGVYIPDFKDEDLYKIVNVIRPEDTAPDSKEGVLFLVDGNGQIKDYLQGEGYKVASDAETLQALLTA